MNIFTLEFWKQFDWNGLVKFITSHPLQIIGAVVALIIGWKIFWALFRYAYHRLTEKNLIYMQITLPREDSPKDKEKDVEKDFRERIAIMEQLYRSLYEIRELSVRNIIRRMLFRHDFISFEIVAHEKVVSFIVVVKREYQSIVEKQITSYYSDADIQFVEPYGIKKPGNKTLAFYAYEKRPFYFPIRTFKTIENDPLNSMTNVLSKLSEDETAIIQLTIRPKGGGWRKRGEEFGTTMMKGKKPPGILSRIPIVSHINTFLTMILFGYERAKETSSNAPGASHGDPFVRMLQTKEERAKHIGEKAQQDGFDSVIRLLVSAKTTIRAREVMNDMVVSLNLFKDPELNFFQTRRIVPLNIINTPWMIHNFKHRVFRFGEKQSIMVPEELASFFHFPTSRYNYTPIIKWLQYKVLPAPADMPTEGLLLGFNTFRGAKREVRILQKDRMRHHYVIGQTGTGKSVFLGWMARQDIRNGEGVCVIDPHGDLIEDILEYVPKERARDVIIFDPSDQERPMGLNILEAHSSQQMDMASSQATEIFLKLFGDEIFGPRLQHYFRNACLTLMEDEDEGATLIDVPRIFVDDDFMKYKVSKVKNPVVRSFWEHEYASTGERERQEMIPYFSAKFGPFITNTIMRNTIGQTRSAFDFREVMDNKKILLIKLSKGSIGDLNTQLLGLVIVARIQMAAMSRVDIPENQRKDFYLYVDEFQTFATDSFCSILSEARKYHLGLIMAHQYINQLVTTKFGTTSSQIRDAVFGNVGTMMSFKIGAEDAEYMAKEYSPLLTEQDVIGIANYKAYIKLNINNSTTRPFSMETIWDEAGKSPKIAEILKQYSRMKYGRKREFVDQEIEARIGIENNS